MAIWDVGNNIGWLVWNDCIKCLNRYNYMYHEWNDIMKIIIWWFGDDLKNRLLLPDVGKINALGGIEMMCLKDILLSWAILTEI